MQDIPLLVENHSAPFFHFVVIVGADEELRVHRLTTSRGPTRPTHGRGSRRRPPTTSGASVADAWLDNSEHPEQLAEAAARLWDERLVPLEEAVRQGAPAEPDAAAVAWDPSPASLETRLTNRLWALCGANATAVEVATSGLVPSLRVVARDDDAVAAITAALPAAACRYVAG